MQLIEYFDNKIDASYFSQKSLSLNDGLADHAFHSKGLMSIRNPEHYLYERLRALSEGLHDFILELVEQKGELPLIFKSQVLKPEL